MTYTMQRKEIVYYPCSGTDMSACVDLLGTENKHYIFADINPRYSSAIKTLSKRVSCEFVVGDVNETVCYLDKPIDILFHRMDSGIEGGSGVWVLGTKSFLPKVLGKFNERGGQIISDGSNSRGSGIEKMIREKGLECNDFLISLSSQQRFTSLTVGELRSLKKFRPFQHLLEFDVNKR